MIRYTLSRVSKLPVIARAARHGSARFAIVILLVLFLFGCAGTYNNSLSFNPLEPIRVAVLPFAFTDSKGTIVEPDKNLLLDQVGLVSSKLKEAPNEYVRRLVQKRLGQSALDVVSPALVDAQISHHGFVTASQAYDYPRIFELQPAEVCRKLLNCDAVLYGKVTRWDRSYYGIQSEAQVAIALKLVSARDGKVLWESVAEDSEGRGLTKVPTGFSDLVIEPIKGLSNDIITGLADKIVDKAVSPLYVKNRPEFLQNAAPAIFASAHDADAGDIRRDRPLTVVMLGSPGAAATFSIGDRVENVPMAEKDEGHYIGEFYGLPSDHFNDLPVFVHLTDQFGRMTSQKLGRTEVSLR
jgi:hypothetical protein